MNDMSQSHGSWTPDGETPPKLTEEALITACATVFDPEIPVNVYELGLIYAIDYGEDGAVKVEMTLTAPGCPSAQELPVQIRDAILADAKAEEDNEKDTRAEDLERFKQIAAGRGNT